MSFFHPNYFYLFTVGWSRACYPVIFSLKEVTYKLMCKKSAKQVSRLSREVILRQYPVL